MAVDELAGLPIGARLQALRERQGRSRAVVAGLVGRSEEWLKAVERGRLQPPRLPMLVRLAEVLGISDLRELTGDHSIVMEVGGRAGHESVAAVREAIEIQMLTAGDLPVVKANDLTRRVADAWALWHSSATPRSSVGAVLPRIITDGRRAVRLLDGPAQRAAHAALSAAYALAETLLAWVADHQAVGLAADRCMTHAEHADDPIALAQAAWTVGNIWRAIGRHDDALNLATDAADLLAPRIDTHETSRALWGAVRLHAAITAAKMGREGDALRHLDDAISLAEQMPAGYAHPITLFGRPNAALTGVSVYVELRKGSHALDAADTVYLDEVPSRDRQSRVRLEAARAHRQRKDNTAALHLLQQATRISREAMTCHPLARSLASELVTQGGRSIEREARSLASTLGVTV